MSCTYKIKNSLSSSTSTEKQLAEYILEHPDEVMQSSAQTLGENSGTSAATVVRFTKKLGFKGFQQFKIALAKDDFESEDPFDDIILQEDTTATLIKKAEHSNLTTVNNTYKLLNAQTVDSAIKLLCNCDTVYLVGMGGSSVVCEDFMHKLTRIHKKVMFFDNYHILIQTLAYMKNDDVLIAVSYSGETREVIEACNIATEHKTPIIAITQQKKSRLVKAADIVLPVPSEEIEMRLGAISSRSASLIISDLLYLGIVKSQPGEYLQKIFKTRSTINKLGK